MLRSHQQQFDDICRKIKGGDSLCKRIIASVTPGGGKSALPVVAAHHLLDGQRFQKLCWVVPRKSLQIQAEESFIDPWLKRTIGHSRKIRIATNELNPSRECDGYVTTYQALNSDSVGVNAKEFSRHRYVLILDEPHHVELGSESHDAILPLIERAALVVFQSGTFARHNGKPIAFLPYRSADGKLSVDLNRNNECEIIKYSLRDALREHAIIPLVFEHRDAHSRWIDRDGEEQSLESFDRSDDDKTIRDGLWAAINTQFALHLLDAAADDWQDRQRVNPRSKLLVVSHSCNAAERHVAHLKKRGIQAAKATSDDADAQEQIQRFKKIGRGGCGALVTVQMAYEGLDVPAVTHIACLTNIRSRPWIEQMFARATRYDRSAGAWETQTAVAFVPDDPMMNEIIREIASEQDVVLKEEMEKRKSSSGNTPADSGSIVPQRSSVAGQRSTELGGTIEVMGDESESIATSMKANGILGIPPLQFKKAMLDCGYLPSQEKVYAQSATIELTPSQEESQIRRDIEKWVRKSERDRGIEHGTINKQLFEYSGKKPRKELTLSELRRQFAYLRRIYPRNG